MARRRSYGGEYEGRREYAGGGGGRYSYGRRRERRREERQVELASFGALILTFAFGLIVHLSPEIISAIGGGILVVAAVYQVQRRWRVNPMTWIGGAIMLAGGALALYYHTFVPLGILFPIGLFALVIVASALSGEF